MDADVDVDAAAEVVAAMEEEAKDAGVVVP